MRSSCSSAPDFSQSEVEAHARARTGHGAFSRRIRRFFARISAVATASAGRVLCGRYRGVSTQNGHVSVTRREVFGHRDTFAHVRAKVQAIYRKPSI
jgi:hypothetical protein